MLQMMAPITQQLNDMKILYENSKATSSDIGGKIDELKRVLAMQSDFYLRPQTMQGNTSFQSMMQQQDLMDPNIIKKGVEDIKEQMREVQREAQQIENDLEKRF